ncbi:MAG: methyltransferase domain-containing protein [Rhodospirillaceae bacterium]
MADTDYRPQIFDVNDLNAAMRIILTPEGGHALEERWQSETPPMADLLAERLAPEADQTVIDYGCGVGRVTKELMARRPRNMISIDISPSMRALSHMFCRNDAFFPVLAKRWARRRRTAPSPISPTPSGSCSIRKPRRTTSR